MWLKYDVLNLLSTRRQKDWERKVSTAATTCRIQRTWRCFNAAVNLTTDVTFFRKKKKKIDKKMGALFFGEEPTE